MYGRRRSLQLNGTSVQDYVTSRDPLVSILSGGIVVVLHAFRRTTGAFMGEQTPPALIHSGSEAGLVGEGRGLCGMQAGLVGEGGKRTW